MSEHDGMTAYETAEAHATVVAEQAAAATALAAEQTAAAAALEYPVPLRQFAASLKGTPDEVYTRLLKKLYGERPRTPSEWQKLIASEAAKPVPRDEPRPAGPPLRRRRGR